MAKSEKKAGKRKPRGEKKKKDPNKPKRGMSAFMFFANQKRPEVRSANPDMKITDIGKELGRLWKELSEDDKKPYFKQAESDKARYTEAMKGYVAPESEAEASDSEDEKPKKKKAKKGKDSDSDSDSESEDEDDSKSKGKKGKRTKKQKKDPNAPKRAASAYILFTNAKRAEVKEQYPDLKMTELSSKLAERWKAATDAEKKVFQDRAAKDKVRYTEEMKGYVAPKAEKEDKKKTKKTAKPAKKAEKPKKKADKSKSSKKSSKKAASDDDQSDSDSSSSSSSASSDSDSGSESESGSGSD